MRVSWHPLYGETGASSRLRVFTLSQELVKMGVYSCVSPLDPRGSDVIVIQKHRDPRVIEDAVRAKAKLLVYDFDDTEVAEIMPTVREHARLVTTDTELHQHWAAMNYGVHPVIIPDPVDYGLTPMAPNPDASGVCWFGNSVNFTMAIRRWLEAIHDSGIRVTCITDTPVVERFDFIPWRLDTFIASLRRHAVCVLSHEGQDPGKSPNKMVAAITAGVPCVVSDTPEYARVAREFCGGLGIATSPAQAVEMAAALTRPEFGRHYLGMAQGRVWERYNPRRVAETWLQTVKERM